MIEIFIPIVGYEALYEVSAFGRVRSLRSGDFLKEDRHFRGYRRVRLFNLGKRANCFLHRVVARAWHPNPDAKEIVNHKDRNKTCNAIYNLEWMTFKENTDHYYECIRLENENF